MTENHSDLTYNYARANVRVVRGLVSLVSFSRAATVVNNKGWYAVAVQLTNIWSRQETHFMIPSPSVNDKWSAIISSFIRHNIRANVRSAANVASLVITSAIPGSAQQFRPASTARSTSYRAAATSPTRPIKSALVVKHFRTSACTFSAATKQTAEANVRIAQKETFLVIFGA